MLTTEIAGILSTSWIRGKLDLFLSRIPLTMFKCSRVGPSNWLSRSIRTCARHGQSTPIYGTDHGQTRETDE